MIQVNVPFKRCHMCQNFVADTYFSKSYANDKLIDLKTIVYCANQDLCKKLYSQAKEDLEKEMLS